MKSGFLLLSDVKNKSVFGWVAILPTILFLSIAAWIFFTGQNHALFLEWNRMAGNFPAGFWLFITYWGNALVCFVLLSYFLYRSPERIVAILIAGLILTVLIQSSKYGFSIKRPPKVFPLDSFYYLVGHKLTSLSFPSGHSASAFFAAGLFAMHSMRWYAISLSLIIGGAIAFSRVAVGVHFPLDIFTGSALGWLLAAFAFLLKETPGYRKTRMVFAGLIVLSCLYLIVDVFIDFHSTNLFHLLPPAISLSFVILFFKKRFLA